MANAGFQPIASPLGVTSGVPRLHVITPDRADASVLTTTAAVIGAGARCVQVRLKSGTDRARLRFASEVVALTRSVGAMCLMDDRADLAVAAGADGVHVGQDDLPVTVARALLGPSAVIGATARDPEAARRAQDEGATYLGVGPVYPSTTKRRGLPDPLGPAGLEKIAAAVDLPVVAISGVTVESVRELRDAGAHGVAVIAAVYGAPDPVEAVGAFLEELGR